MINYSKAILTLFLWSLLTIASSFSAKLSLQPSGGVLIANCPNSIKIILDTEGTTTNTVDVKIIDNHEFTLHSISDTWAIFGSYTKSMQSKIRQWKYKWKNAIYLLWTNPWIGRFNWKGIFTTLNIIPHPNTSGNVSINFYILPKQNADDSNVSVVQWDKVIDVLNQTIWAQYTVITWTCPTVISWSVSIQESDYYIKHLDKLKDKNTLFTVEEQEKIKIPTKIVNNSIRKSLIQNLRQFIKKLFSS